ncbi:MAG: hypothetical protein ABIP64_14475 [Burkholderiales bacterium]
MNGSYADLAKATIQPNKCNVHRLAWDPKGNCSVGVLMIIEWDALG